MAGATFFEASECPCASGRRYAVCCEPLHRGAPPDTAEQVMRARYSAHARKDGEYLLRSWSPRTRVPDAGMGEETWTALRVVATDAGGPGDDEGTVTFEADWELDGHRGTHRETSRFVRHRGRWVYDDAV